MTNLKGKGARPCPGCFRARSACWIMPCLHLERVMARGAGAVQRWVRAGVASKHKAHIFVEAR